MTLQKKRIFSIRFLQKKNLNIADFQFNFFKNTENFEAYFIKILRNKIYVVVK